MARNPKFDIYGNPIKEEKCALCGRHKMDHKARTFHCPLSRHQFTHFSQHQTYKAKDAA